MNRRIFLGIPVSDELLREVVSWQHQHAHLPLRWTSKENLHVTLVPPWYEQDIGPVIQALIGLQGQIPELFLSFSSIVFGPRPVRPRLLWAEGKASAELYELRERLQVAVEQDSNRKLRPHITLGRCLKPLESDFDYQGFQATVNWDSVSKTVVLFESLKTEKGSDYKKLLEIS